jgi:hypothetical protein
VKTQTRKNALISGIHLIVGLLQRGFIDMKGVGVFHDELARSHHTKTRSAFITKLGLNLVNIYWQLFVTAELIANKVGDNFFMSRPKAEVAHVSILEALQLVTHDVPAA